MKKYLTLFSLFAFSISAFSQTLYVPNATTTGIANNTTNSNVGIGTSAPADQLEIVTGTRKVGFNGSIPGGTSVGGLLTLGTVSGGKNFFMGYAPYSGVYQDPVIANLMDYSEMRFVSGNATLTHGFAFYVNQDATTNYGFSATRPSNPIVKINAVGLAIGTNNPGAKLDVVGLGGTNVDIRSTGRIATGDSNLAGGIWVNGAKTMMFGQTDVNKLGIYNGGDWRVVVNSAGQTGIGVAIPLYRLHVQGTGGSTVDMRVNGRMGTGDASNLGGLFVNSSNTMMFGQVDAGTMGLYNNNQWRMVVSNNGRVGVGTTTPVAQLDVAGAGGNSADIKVNGRIQSGDAGTTGGFVVGTGGNMVFGQVNATTMGLYSNNLWRLVVLNNGRVGIGTTTPVSQLDITGTGGTTSDIKVNGRLQSGDAGNTGGLIVGTGTTLMFGQQSATTLGLYNNGAWRLIADNAGNIGIGTTAPDAMLAVKGKVHAKEVKVDLTGALAPDYVFEKNYDLPSLKKIEEYVEKNHHLPEVPSAKEIEANGMQLGEMNLLLLKKIEELTLYMIEQQKQIDDLKAKVEKQK